MNITRIFLDANEAGLQELTTAEKLATGLRVMALGLLTVFAVLAILWIVLLLFRVIFYHEKKPEPQRNSPDTAAQSVPKTLPVPTPAPVPATVLADAPAAVPAPTPAVTDDGALIAAITAAIAAYTEGDEAFASGFRVVSFRRAEHASPWNRSK